MKVALVYIDNTGAQNGNTKQEVRKGARRDHRLMHDCADLCLWVHRAAGSALTGELWLVECQFMSKRKHRTGSLQQPASVYGFTDYPVIVSLQRA